MNRKDRIAISRLAAVLSRLESCSASHPADIARVAKYNAYAPKVIRSVYFAMWELLSGGNSALDGVNCAEESLNEHFPKDTGVKEPRND